MIDFAIMEIAPQQHLTPERLNALPAWRRRKTLSYLRDTDRLQCAEAYLLLVNLLQKNFPELSATEITREFQYNPEGKPRLAGADGIYFSISHCPQAVMAAVSDVPVGCDIEAVPVEADSVVMDYCFSTEERRRVDKSARPAKAFTKIWTRKEALYKLDNSLTLDATEYDAAKLHNYHILTQCAPNGCVYSIATTQ